MFNDFLKFNLKMLPVHIILCVILAFGFSLTASKENWYQIGLNAIIQLYILGSIPNFIYLFKRRKKPETFKSFLATFALFSTPYILTVIIMKIVMFNFGYF